MKKIKQKPFVRQGKNRKIVLYPSFNQQDACFSIKTQKNQPFFRKPYKPYLSSNKAEQKYLIQSHKKYVSDKVIVLHLQNLKRHPINPESRKRTKKINSLIDSKSIRKHTNGQNKQYSKESKNNFMLTNYQTLLIKDTGSEENKQFIRARKKKLLQIQINDKPSQVNKIPLIDFLLNQQISSPCKIKTIHLSERYHNEVQKKRQLIASKTNRINRIAHTSCSHHRYLQKFRTNNIDKSFQIQEKQSKQCLQPWKIYQSTSKII